MLIQYLPYIDIKLIVITADELTSFIDNLNEYEKIIVTIDDCNTSIVVEKIADVDEIQDDSDTSKFYFSNDVLYIKPIFLGLTDFIDSLLKITIRLQKENGYVQIQNCYFVDVTYKCKVAALLQNIIKENKDNSIEKISTIIHLLHYGLTNASNCGCNCEELCTVFTELTNLLKDIDPEILSDCGC